MQKILHEAPQLETLEVFKRMAALFRYELDEEARVAMLALLNTVIPLGPYVHKECSDRTVQAERMGFVHGGRVFDVFVVYTDQFGNSWPYPMLWFLDTYRPLRTNDVFIHP